MQIKGIGIKRNECERKKKGGNNIRKWKDVKYRKWKTGIIKQRRDEWVSNGNIRK